MRPNLRTRLERRDQMVVEALPEVAEAPEEEVEAVVEEAAEVEDVEEDSKSNDRSRN